jgi:uracil-DNA glycosylase family 4
MGFQQGIFGPIENSKKKAPKKKKLEHTIIPILNQTGLTCSDCPLDKAELKHPKMEPTGAKRPLLYILGEAPGATEDEYGEQFIGEAGAFIRDFVPRKLNKYIRWNNVLRCRPPENRTPTEHEMRCCSRLQRADISTTQPVIVAGFGNVPLDWALDRSGITRWHGMLIPIKIGSHKCWYAPMWHPSYIMRARHQEEKGPEIFRMYKEELYRIFDMVSELLDGGAIDVPDVPEGDELSSGIVCELSWSLKSIEKNLTRLADKYKRQAIDVETSHLRPYYEDYRILSIAVGTWESSYAIPLEHPKSEWTSKQLKKLYRMLEEYITDSKLTFCAHNLKFEQEALRTRMGDRILFEANWADSMAQAHTLHDQREKSLGARSQALLGVDNKRLDNLDKENMANEPLDKILLYNGRDVKFTERIWCIQSRMIKRDGLVVPYRMMVSRTPALVMAQARGVIPSTKVAETKLRELALQINLIRNKINCLKSVKEFVNETGKPFNPGSPVQIKKVLNIKKGGTDESVLSRMKHPLARLVLDLRAAIKLSSTYVEPYCPSAGAKHIYPDGLIHTNFNHLVTSTGRLASEDPNLQNFPIRSALGKRVRDIIVAQRGHKIVSVDYGQIEARIIAIASGDENLIKALWEHYDIHMDWILKITNKFPKLLEPHRTEENNTEKKVIKSFRQFFKSEWTFPLFFGSELDPVAARWKIPVYKLQPFYDEFWDRYAEVRKWQRRLIAQYKKDGYVSSLTGRRRYGPLSINELINSPIQGTASDIVVDAMERLAKKGYEEDRPQLQPRLNVHDDLTFYLPDDSIEEDLEDIIEIMCQPKFSWLNVPITIEIKLGKSWGKLEELADVESSEEFGYPKRPALASQVPTKKAR